MHHHQSKFHLEILLILTGLITSIASFSVSDKSNYYWWSGPEFSVIQKVYEDCQDTNDFTGCLKGKALLALTKAIDQDSVKIVEGLTLEKQNTTEKDSIIGLTDARTMNSLSPLDRSLFQKLDQFLRTHVVKIDMNEEKESGRREGGSGSGGGGGGGGGSKKGEKGMVKYVVAALLTAMGIAGPIGLKALAVIAGKALVISKVALTIASIIALKKLFSHDHHEETSFQVHSGEHNRRNTYVVRPVRPSAATIDPYRYYYEYPTH